MEITTGNASRELLRFRENYGISINELVEKTGVSKPTVIGIEKGRVKPQATTIYKINQYIKKLKSCTEDM